MTLPFPNNVVEELKVAFETLDVISPLQDGGKAVFRRPVRPTDPQTTIGVFPMEWQPDDNSIEMIGGGRVEPTLQTYQVAVQGMVRDGDEAAGLVRSSLLNKAIRSMLYRDPALRVALSSLSEDSLGVEERAQRWGVRNQRFANNEVGRGQFMFLSTTDMWLQTETV